MLVLAKVLCGGFGFSFLVMGFAISLVLKQSTENQNTMEAVSFGLILLGLALWVIVLCLTFDKSFN